MTTTKTTPYRRIGLTLTEMYAKGYLRVIAPGNWQGDVPAHHLKKKENGYICIKCNFETVKVSDLRKNKGCNAFSNKD